LSRWLHLTTNLSSYETSTGITIALQSHTSALVTRGFRVLSFEDFDRIAWQKSHNAKPTNRPSSTIDWAATDNLRYIQNITTNDQIRDTSLWKNISALECAKYGVLQTETSTLLIVLNETPEQGFAYQDPLLVPYSSFSYSHILAVYLRKELYFTHGTPEEDWVNTNKWLTHWLTRVSYCLSRKVPGRSHLQVHLWFLLTATALNVIKLGCLLSAFKEHILDLDSRGFAPKLVFVKDMANQLLAARSARPVDIKWYLFDEILITF
jgi:hypothetical protein